MSERRLVLLAVLGHAGLLAGAFAFQLAGYAPCRMCLWQRWPHWAALAFGALVLARIAPRATAALAGLAALATAGIGAFHAGVEQGWWPGPASCSGGGAGLSGLSGADLLSTDVADAIVMCDDIAWQLGLSMAGWNAVLSLALAALWFVAWRGMPAGRDRAGLRGGG